MASVSVDSARSGADGRSPARLRRKPGQRHPCLVRQRRADERAGGGAQPRRLRSMSCARCTAAIPASSIMPPAAPSSRSRANGWPPPPRRWRRSAPTSPGSRSPPARSPRPRAAAAARPRSRRSASRSPLWRNRTARAARSARLWPSPPIGPRSAPCSRRPATRFGVTLPPSRLGGREALRAVADDAQDSERALLFGAQQLALQHRALWDLLEARAQARRDY